MISVEAFHKRLDGILSTDGLVDTIYSLADRWSDEGGYEDIKDYGDVLKKLLPADVSLIKMTKRPFGMHIKVDDYKVHVYRRLYSNRMSIIYKPLR